MVLDEISGKGRLFDTRWPAHHDRNGVEDNQDMFGAGGRAYDTWLIQHIVCLRVRRMNLLAMEDIQHRCSTLRFHCANAISVAVLDFHYRFKWTDIGVQENNRLFRRVATHLRI